MYQNLYVHASGEAVGLQPQDPRNSKHQNLKNNTFVETTISNVLYDLPFRRNQPEKSSDGW